MSDQNDATFYDLTLVGISPAWKAALVDEQWIAGACPELRNVGPQEYLKKMIQVVREKLGGEEKKLRPHRNDICSCGSGKKFGRCCASQFEAGDPEDCLTVGHLWQSWTKIPSSGKYFRNCQRCNGFENAPDYCEMTLKGDLKVLSIGCAACKTTVVDMDQVYEVVQAYQEKDACAACGKPFNTDLMVVGHVKKPAGCVLEVIDKSLRLDDFIDLASAGAFDGEGAGIHDACFEKLLPFWKRVCSS